MTFYSKKCFLTFFLVMTFSYSLIAEAGVHSLTLEYVPVLAQFAAGGKGVGLSYEYRIKKSMALKGTGYTGFIPVNTGGFITMAGIEGALNFYPLKTAGEGLILRSGAGCFYLGALGEQSYGGLVSHFINFYLEEALGWRFLLGKGNIKVLIQPEVIGLFAFPGFTASGPADNLNWSGTGFALAAFYPNIVMGVNF